jgi:hypothetical protein
MLTGLLVPVVQVVVVDAVAAALLANRDRAIDARNLEAAVAVLHHLVDAPSAKRF